MVSVKPIPVVVPQRNQKHEWDRFTDDWVDPSLTREEPVPDQYAHDERECVVGPTPFTHHRGFTWLVQLTDKTVVDEED